MHMQGEEKTVAERCCQEEGMREEGREGGREGGREEKGREGGSHQLSWSNVHIMTMSW